MRRSVSFTRPSDTSAYAAGDLVANNTSAGSVVVPTVSFTDAAARVRRIVLRTNNATITNGDFRLWVLSSTPTVANGDNGAIGGAAFNTVLDVVPISLTASMANVGGYGFADLADGRLQVGGPVYLLLEARAAYTPTSGQVFTVEIEVAR